MTATGRIIPFEKPTSVPDNVIPFRQARSDPYTLCDCAHCPLLPQRQPVRGAGNPNAKLLIVADNPDLAETKANAPLQGLTGALLDQTLAAAGTSRADVYVTHAVACRSVNSRKEDVPPPKEAIAACRPRLLAEIEAIKPKAILTVGATAAAAMLPGKQRLTELEGVAERHRGTPILPTFSPAVVLHGGQDDQFEAILTTVKRAAMLARGEMMLPPENERIHWHHVADAAMMEKWLCKIRDGNLGYNLALDVETNGLDTISDKLLLIAIGGSDGGVSLEYPGLLDHAGDNRSLLLCILRDDRFTWSMHNSSFDLQILRRAFGVTPRNVVDTLCLAMGTTEIAKRIGLKTQARTWLNAGFYEREVREYVNKDENSSWESVPRPILAKYAVYDVVMTERLRPVLTNLCRTEGTLDLAHKLLMPAQRAFADIESHGVLVDLTYLNQLEKDWQPKIDEARAAIEDYAAAQGWRNYAPITTIRDKKAFGYFEMVEAGMPEAKALRLASEKRGQLIPLNPNSPPQMQRFVFDKLKLPPFKGKRSTDKDWRGENDGHPFVQLIEDYQLANHMMSSYVRGISKHVRADGRVHPNFKIFGARTGRLSMGDPALQTIPSEDLLEDGETKERKFDSIKRIFLPSPGHVFCEIDYAQLELRVAWHLTGDEQLGEAIMSGDFHRYMASRMFGVPIADVTKAQRRASKSVTFGLAYGRQAPAIAQAIGVSVETAQHLIDGFFASAPKYRAWYYEQHRNALETGRSTTVFGRVRRWHLITPENKQNVLNQSVNFPPQSTASDLTLAAMIRIHPQLVERRLGHVLFVVHDSIVSELREGKEREAIELMQREMTTWPFPSCAVLATEAKVGPTWGDTKVWAP